MTHTLLMIGLVGALFTAGPVFAQGVGEVNRPARDIQYAPADPNIPTGPRFGPLWGDIFTEPSGFMILLPAGFVSDMHVHSADYRGVVITGVVVNAQVGESNPTRLPAGSYWFQPSNARHTTTCEPGADCLTYVQFMGPFDSKREP